MNVASSKINYTVHVASEEQIGIRVRNENVRALRIVLRTSEIFPCSEILREYWYAPRYKAIIRERTGGHSYAICAKK